MAEIMAALTAIGSQIATAAATAGSFAAANAGTIATVASAAGTVYGGIRANQASKVEAKSLKAKGDAELAIGQRKAMKSRQEKDLLLSRQRAVAAGSGAGATDQSVEAIMARTEQAGEYNALIDMYNGMQSRADLYHESGVVRREGKSALKGSLLEGAAGIYGGIARNRRNKAELAYEGA